jgi:hypothetical protein
VRAFCSELICVDVTRVEDKWDSASCKLCRLGCLGDVPRRTVFIQKYKANVPRLVITPDSVDVEIGTLKLDWHVEILDSLEGLSLLKNT